MRATILLLALAITAVFCTPTRIFLWSNSQIQSQGVTQEYQVVSSSEIVPLLLASTGANTQSDFAKYFAQNAPEFSVVLLTSTNTLQQTSVKNALESFSGSVAFPYVNSVENQHFVEEFISRLSDDKLIFAGSSRFQLNHQSESIENVLKKAQAGELNQKVIVIDLTEQSVSEIDQIVESINNVIAQRNAVAVLVQHSAESLNMIELPQARKQFTTIRKEISFGFGASPPYTTKWPAYIIEGIFVSIFLAAIALVGVVCSCQIQPPLAFETKPKTGNM